MGGAPGWIDDLAAIVGLAHVATDPEVTRSFATDWTGRFVGTTPAVVSPATTDEIAEVVACCRRHRVALVPQGGNTGLVGGSVPLAGEVVVSTRRLRSITDVDPDAGQLTAQAGATVAEVQRAAETAGWRYGVDFAARDSATIGGSIATNAGGLRVIRHGMTRRQLLGVEAVLGDGSVIRQLSGLVKDNTGFDLAGLLCGSEGTLGIVTGARLALVPAAGATCTAQIACASVADAVSITGALRRAVPTLEAVEVVLADGVDLVEASTGRGAVVAPAPVVLVVEAVGPPDPSDDLAAVLDDAAGVVDVAVATDGVRAAELWHVREAHTESIARHGTTHKFDVTVPQAALAGFVAEVGSVVAAVAPSATTWVFGHLADGNLHVNVTGIDDDGPAGVVADAVLGRVVADGGSISAEHGVGTAKRRWLARSRTAGDLDAMRAIKAALDPDGICNPAVLL